MQQSKFRAVILLAGVFNLVHTGGGEPVIPMIVSGSVYINGAPAPADTVIRAMSGGEVEGSYTLLQPGTYGMTVEYKQGEVEFYVDDIKAQSMEWNSEPRVLNLTVTVTQTSQGAATAAPATVSQQKKAVERSDLQKRDVIKMSGFTAMVFVFAVLLASNTKAGRKK